MSEESHEVEASKEMDTTLNNTVPEAPNDNDTTMEVEKEIASPDPPLIDSQLKENVPSIKMEDDSGELSQLERGRLLLNPPFITVCISYLINDIHMPSLYAAAAAFAISFFLYMYMYHTVILDLCDV